MRRFSTQKAVNIGEEISSGLECANQQVDEVAEGVMVMKACGHVTHVGSCSDRRDVIQEQSGAENVRVQPGVSCGLSSQARDRLSAQAVLFDMKTEECEMVEEGVEILQRMSSFSAANASTPAEVAGATSNQKSAPNRVKKSSDADVADGIQEGVVDELNDIEEVESSP